MRTITEKDIIEARRRVAEASAKGGQLDFEDALLASPELVPGMIQEWLDASVNVHWCACGSPPVTPPRIVCEVCELPLMWTPTAAPGQSQPNED